MSYIIMMFYGSYNGIVFSFWCMNIPSFHVFAWQLLICLGCGNSVEEINTEEVKKYFFRNLVSSSIQKVWKLIDMFLPNSWWVVQSDRQKQYFEQRKRQLEQQTARQENYSDTTNTCTQPPINSQSLDILSLLDLSTISQEHRSNCPRGKPV